MLIESRLPMWYMNGSVTSIRADLLYDSSDPYAVTIIFNDDSASDDERDEQVVWTLARELLIDGLKRRSGVGDVRVWPLGTDGQYIALELRSHDGSGILRMPRLLLKGFLKRTLVAVPKGLEFAHLDIDTALGKIFADS